MKIDNLKTFKTIVTLFLLCLFLGINQKASAQADPQKVTKENFHGVIELDIRNSKPDWKPYTKKQHQKVRQTYCLSYTMTQGRLPGHLMEEP